MRLERGDLRRMSTHDRERADLAELRGDLGDHGAQIPHRDPVEIEGVAIARLEVETEHDRPGRQQRDEGDEIGGTWLHLPSVGTPAPSSRV